MGVCGSRKLKLEEVTITEKPPEAAKPFDSAAEKPAAEMAAGTAKAGTADDGVLQLMTARG